MEDRSAYSVKKRELQRGTRAFAGVMVIVLLTLCSPRISRAHEATLLSSKQVALLSLRILSFDRALAKRTSKDARVLVLYKLTNEESELEGKNLLDALKSVRNIKVSGMPVRVYLKSFDGKQFASDLEKIRPAAIYVCSGLASELATITQAATQTRSLTISSTESYVKSGLSVALVAGARKVRILINLKASRAEGVRFDAGLLRLAEVLK